MNLKEAKILFKRYCPEETKAINRKPHGGNYDYSCAMWEGFRLALRVTGILYNKR